MSLMSELHTPTGTLHWELVSLQSQKAIPSSFLLTYSQTEFETDTLAL